MKAIADEDLNVLKSAARKWLDATLSRGEYKAVSEVLARLDDAPLAPLVSPPHRESIWQMYGGAIP